MDKDIQFRVELLAWKLMNRVTRIIRTSLSPIWRNSLRVSRLSCVPLESTTDAYNGVYITENVGTLSSHEFQTRLEASLQVWQKEKRKGVWLRVAINSAHLVPVAVSQGFWYHHCNHNYLLMCNWLQGGKEASKLPPAPTHFIGVAGFVINSHRELLVVQEKNGPAAGVGLWKLPGGLLDLHEDIAVGVVREVREETGIDCSFERVVAIVEGHHGRGPARESASDLYMVSILHCHDEGQAITPQAEEIEKCEWVPVQDVMRHPFYQSTNAFGICLKSVLSVCDNSRRPIHRAVNSMDSANKKNSNNQTFDTSLPDMSEYGLRRGVYPIGIGKSKSSVYLAHAMEPKR